MRKIILTLALVLTLNNSFGGQTSLIQQTNKNESHFVFEQKTNSSFIRYMMDCENGVRNGWNPQKGLWFPYQDPSGWSIGYGHFLSENERQKFSDGISEKAAVDILKQDLDEAYKIADKWFWEEHRVSLRSLKSSQVEMILDFTFNLGSPKFFPKFMNALLNNDISTMRKEYKRYFNGMELTDRNNRFYSRFLSEGTNVR